MRKIVEQPLRGLVAVVGILGQQLGDELRQDRPDPGIQGVDVLGHRCEVHLHEARRARGGEGHLAGRALKQHAAQRIEIGATIHRALEETGLLGRAVEQRPGHRVVARRAIIPVARLDRQAEVDEPRHPLTIDEDVRRLDVAVHVAEAVHLGERAGDLFASKLDDARFRQRLASRSAPSRPSASTNSRSR